MTYTELIKKIQREIANDTFRSYFASTPETVDLTSTNKERLLFINPWYSTPDGGMKDAFFHISQTEADYVILLIKESSGAGAGRAGEYQREILKKARLLASIKMPPALMVGMGASVQTAIYVFDTRYKHKEELLVKFIDFSVDGYDRKKNKNSTPLIKDIDHADERYMELLAHILGKKPKTSYYTEENGLLIKEPITLDGEDWAFSQHKHIDTTITEHDLKATFAEYMTWKIQLSLKGKKKHEVHKQKFHEFYIDDIFTIDKPRKTFKMTDVELQDLPDDIHHPLITSTAQDNGRTGYIEAGTEFLCPARTLSVSRATKTSFYQPESYFATQDIWILKLKDEDEGVELTENVGLYLLQGIRNLIGHMHWEDKFNQQMFRTMKISLPCTDNFKIDYRYIDTLMTSIKKVYSEELEAKGNLEVELLCKICGFKPPKV